MRRNRLEHGSIRMTMRYAIYSPAGSSTHYDAALDRMGLGTTQVVDIRQKGHA